MNSFSVVPQSCIFKEVQNGSGSREESREIHGEESRRENPERSKGPGRGETLRDKRNLERSKESRGIAGNSRNWAEIHRISRDPSRNRRELQRVSRGSNEWQGVFPLKISHTWSRENEKSLGLGRRRERIHGSIDRFIRCWRGKM